MLVGVCDTNCQEPTSRHGADDRIDEGELGKHVEVKYEQRPAVRN